jgi:hypothetical protein
MATTIHPAFSDTPNYDLGSTIPESHKILKEHGMYDFAIQTFLKCSHQHKNVTTEYTDKFKKYAINTEAAGHLLSKMDAASADLRSAQHLEWGGDDEAVKKQKEDLLRLVAIAKDEYDITVPKHLHDCLEHTTATSEHFNLDLEGMKEAKTLCQHIIDMNSKTEEGERLELNEKQKKMNDMMKLLLSLVSSIDDAIKKILQNHTK